MSIRSKIAQSAGWLGTRLGRFFEPVRDCWKVLTFCLFSALTVVMVAVFLILVPEGQEVLLLLHNPPANQAWYVTFLVNTGFVAAVLLWAVMVWYWPRVILSFQYPEWPPAELPAARDSRIRWLHRWVPRILGSVAFVIVAGAIVRSAFQYTHPMDHKNPVALLTILILLAGSAFLFFVIKRRDWFTVTLPELGQKPLNKIVLDLPRQTRYVLFGSILAFVVEFVLFWIRPLNIWLAPKVSAPTILMLAAGAWVGLGSAMVYWARSYRIPLFTVLFVLAALYSLWNDNHGVRYLVADAVPAAQATDHHSMYDRFDQWRQQRSREATSSDPIPVIIVAADGGGIRAAYWTFSVLAGIQQERPDFARHIFVISGVSGGSLGAAMFTALIAGREDPDMQCKASEFLRCGQDMLKQDFLAPTFATMLYPDLFQRFWPFPVLYWDRARTLERTWEKAWKNVTGTSRFEHDFHDLWKNGTAHEVPNLILNSTSAEKGNRVLISNFTIQQDINDCLETQQTISGIFKDVYDYHHELNLRKCNTAEKPMRRTSALSTAVNGSARFAFVSPAGMVNPRLHIVDGGYFENSGATTAEEVVLALRASLPARFRPIVLHISNEPELAQVAGRLQIPPTSAANCVYLEVTKETADRLEQVKRCAKDIAGNTGITVALLADNEAYNELREKQGSYMTVKLDKDDKIIGLVRSKPWILAETLTPLKTVIQTREGRGVYAIKHLEALMAGEGSDRRFFHFGLRQGTIRLPLGWTLSQDATKDMDDQLKKALHLDQASRCSPEHIETLSLYLYMQKCWPHNTRL